MCYVICGRIVCTFAAHFSDDMQDRLSLGCRNKLLRTEGLISIRNVFSHSFRGWESGTRCHRGPLLVRTSSRVSMWKEGGEPWGLFDESADHVPGAPPS